MRPAPLTLLAVVALLVAAPCASAATLLLDSGGGGDRNNFTGTVGHTFTTPPSYEIDVTALGWFDKNQDGFNTSHQVGLWDSGGTLLGSVTMPAGTGATLDGDYRYVDLATAVTLDPEATYVIAATVGSGDGDIWRNNNAGPLPTVNSHLGVPGALLGRFTTGAFPAFPGNNGGGVNVFGPGNLIATQGAFVPPSLTNGSFEVDPPHPLTGPTGWVATGFNTAGNTRITFIEGPFGTAGVGTTVPYPAGIQALGIRNNDGAAMSIHQDIAIIEEGTYALSFSVADRTQEAWLNYAVELLAVDMFGTETTLVAEDSDLNAAIRPVNGSASHPSPWSGIEGDWLNVVLDGDAGASLVGQTLRVRFSSSAASTGDAGTGTSNDFALDAVGLGFTPIPEPSSIMLLGLSGLLGLFAMRTRRK